MLSLWKLTIMSNWFPYTKNMGAVYFQCIQIFLNTFHQIWKYWTLNLVVLYFYNYVQSFFQTSGPSLPIALHGHSMVKLGKGQAILGGRSYDVYQAKIYSMTCISKNCIISLLDRELSVPKYRFVAISIPDTISECISGGKNDS